MLFKKISKQFRANCNVKADLVDLVKSFPTRVYYLPAKFGFDTAENGPLKVCQKLAKSWNTN